MMLCRYAGLVVVLNLASFPARAQVQADRPLPELQEFLKGVRSHLRSDRLLLSQYTYTEKDTIQELGKQGRVQSIHEQVYEVYPSLEPGLTYRRLISKDGKPSSQKDIEKQDREQDKKMKGRARKLEQEGTDERTRRQVKEAEEKRKEDETIDEAFRLYQIAIIGRESVAGHPAIVLSFRPRPNYKPRVKDARTLAKVAGRAWFSELEHELIRIEIQLLDNISFGWGLLARLNKGATAELQRRKINNEIWLPTTFHFAGSARLLLLKGMNVDATSEYSDFMKFTVETQVKFRK